MNRRRACAVVVATGVAGISLLAVDTGPAVAGGVTPMACRTLRAVDDHCATASTSTLRTHANAGILRNDCGRPLQIVVNSAPSHGTLTLAANGAFTYSPYRGFTGTDTFTYSVTNTGQEDNGEFLVVDTDRAQVTSTATVSIQLR